MNGYFKAKLKTEGKELRLLELEDCDYVEDDDVILRPAFGRKHTCPRCGAINRTTLNDPFCTECNWDSVTDPLYEKDLCVA